MTDCTDDNRCTWANASEKEKIYHDTEWGVPAYDDAYLFEMLTLESAQSGLSWSTILAKREGYREAFLQFDAVKVAEFDEQKIDALVQNPAIVRHRQKITSTVNNAKVVLQVSETHGNLSNYLWGLVGNQIQQNVWQSVSDVPAVTDAAKDMSKALKKDGFKFLGPTTCYAFMQAVGMVNDHVVSCPRHKQCQA